MILLIDNSNTRTKFMLAEDGVLLVNSYDVVPTADLTFENIYAKLQGAQLTAVVIASVVPWASTLLKSVCESVCPKVCMLNAQTEVEGLVYDYPGKMTLGADRIANVIGAAQHYPLPCIAIDAGTAITFDVILPDTLGVKYVGGAIAPGVSTMLSSLNKSTALLPHVTKMSCPVSPVGKDTLEAINAGVYWGAKGMLESIIRQMEVSIGTAANVVITGGDARLLSSVLPRIDVVDEWLTFRGLMHVAQHQM